jgi:GNAT superfamily N-acetyltransferase
MIQKIPERFKQLFQYLNLETNVMILFKSGNFPNCETKAVVCKVTDSNIRDVCRYEAKKYLKKYNHFLARGDVGYYAYLNGKWVHRSWFIIGPNVIRRFSYFPAFRLREREAYAHFIETAPEARGNNIALAVLSRAASDLKNSVDHIYSLVDEKNLSSIRLHEKAGFTEIKRMKKTGFLWFSFFKVLE